MTGFKALWGWIKAHPAVAAIFFLVLVPVFAFGLMVRVRGFLTGVPLVKDVIAKQGLGA